MTPGESWILLVQSVLSVVIGFGVWHLKGIHLQLTTMNGRVRQLETDAARCEQWREDREGGVVRGTR